MVAGKSLLVGLFAFTAWGQISDKIFYFAHLESPQAMQEVTNMVRMIGDMRDVSLDVAKRSLTVKGTADQIAAASWLTAEMDKPGSAPGTRDLPFNDAKAPLAQVVYLSHVDNPRELQEIVNAVRSVTDILRCSPMNQQKAIVMRGSGEQVKAADWLLGVLDQPAATQPGGAAEHEYRLAGGPWDASGLVVQVAHVSATTRESLQQTVNAIRTETRMSRAYPLFAQSAVVMRGTADQLAQAQQVIQSRKGK